MKKSRIFVYSMVLATVFTFGPLSAEAAETSGSASVDIMSNYVWRGFKLSDRTVLQPSVGVTYGGFGANLWANYDIDLNEQNETDLSLNYGFTADRFSFDAGYIYYALDGIDDTQEVYISVGYDSLLSPALTVYYDFDEGDGAFIVASVGHSVDIRENIFLDLGASVSYNADSEYSIGDYRDFHNGELSASVSIPITNALSVSPKIAYSFPLSDDAEDALEAVSVDGDNSIFYGGLNITLSF